MRQGLRRTIGLGGAAFVAVGAALALTLPATAHVPTFTATCDTENHQMVLTIDLEQYAVDTKGNGVNTVTATDQIAGGKLITLVPAGTTFKTMFKATFDASSKPATGPADVKNTFVVTVKAWDDPDGKKGFSTTFTKDVNPCVVTPTTTTAPPTTTTVPPTTTHAATTTTTAVVAAASSQLPNTGVNAGMPLLIAGVLVVAGGGILLWLRLAAKRRSTNN